MLLKLQNRPFEQCFIKLNTRNSRAKSSHCRGSCQASLSTQKDIKDNRASRQGRVPASWCDAPLAAAWSASSLRSGQSQQRERGVRLLITPTGRRHHKRESCASLCVKKVNALVLLTSTLSVCQPKRDQRSGGFSSLNNIFFFYHQHLYYLAQDMNIHMRAVGGGENRVKYLVLRLFSLIFQASS